MRVVKEIDGWVRAREDGRVGSLRAWCVWLCVRGVWLCVRARGVCVCGCWVWLRVVCICVVRVWK